VGVCFFGENFFREIKFSENINAKRNSCQKLLGDKEKKCCKIKKRRKTKSDFLAFLQGFRKIAFSENVFFLHERMFPSREFSCAGVLPLLI